MPVNRLRLSGTVCRTPVRKVSPSGIPHCQFVLEHQSMQQEAGFPRQARCRIPVIVSGAAHQAITQCITVGTPVVIFGFISSHHGRNGLNQLVLHAEQIELKDSGDPPNGTFFPSS